MSKVAKKDEFEINQSEVIKSIIEVIRGEAEALNDLIEHVDVSYTNAIELLVSSHGKVVVTGMGKSGLIARKIAATMSSTGTLAVFMHPAEAMHGDLGIVESTDVIIAIGKSGESEEINNILPVIRKIGAKIISITSNKNSTLANNSDVVLYGEVKNEVCPHNLAPTSSTTVALAIGDAIAITLMKLKNFKPENFALYHPGGLLGRRLLLTVKDLMIPAEKCPILNPETSSISDVIMELSEKGLGVVLFQSQDSKLDGILTDGDIRSLLKTHQHRIFDLSLQEVVNKSPTIIEEDLLAAEALRIMENRDKPLNVVPVINSGKLVGVVRLHELLEKI